jgi:hypothetical protein
MGWRDITNSTNERTLIATVVPLAATGDTFLLMMPQVALQFGSLLPSCLSSVIVDYAARWKIGGTHLKFHVFEQLPVLPPHTYSQSCHWAEGSGSLCDWLLPRVLELTCTAWDLQPFARDCGYDGPPFKWDEARRFLLRSELDAAYIHLYGIERNDVDYIMDTFPIVKRKDEAKYKEYRTKRVILEMYDAMAEAMKTGNPCQTRLAPPPADPRVAYPCRDIESKEGN